MRIFHAQNGCTFCTLRAHTAKCYSVYDRKIRFWGAFASFFRDFLPGGEAVKFYAEKFYGSDAWRSCRESFLHSKQFLCERCSTNSNPVPAKIAHHKIRITPENIRNPAITLAWRNLEALCQDCHNREHHGGKAPARYTFDADGRVIPV